LEELDGIVRKVYGCTFPELISKIFHRAYRNGFYKGLQKGRRLGRRAAKGLKGEPKKRGRPPKIDSSIRTLLMVHVDREREKGKPAKEAITEFLEIMQVGSTERLKLATTETSEAPLPNTAQAVGAYYRDRKKKPRDRKGTQL
jgi:hypothetical protein